MFKVALRSLNCLQSLAGVQSQRIIGLNRVLSSVAVKSPPETIPVASANIPKTDGPRVSIVKHPHILPPADHVPAASTTHNKFAVIALSGRQYKVTEDDVIVADKMEGVDIGQVVDIHDVLLLGSKNSTVIGRPLLPKTLVRLEVEELTKDRKVIAFKTRRRKSSRRTRGFRRDLTVLRVKEIVVGEDVQGDFEV
eukprot:gene33029-39954_t